MTSPPHMLPDTCLPPLDSEMDDTFYAQEVMGQHKFHAHVREMEADDLGIQDDDGLSAGEKRVYASLQDTVMDSPLNLFNRPNRLDSWQDKSPEKWSCHDVLNWVYHIADTSGMDSNVLRGEKFNTCTGAELCTFTLEEFLRREPTYGEQFFGCLKVLQQTVKDFIPPHELNDFADEHLLSQYGDESIVTEAMWSPPLPDWNALECNTDCVTKQASLSIGRDQYDYDPNNKMDDLVLGLVDQHGVDDSGYNSDTSSEGAALYTLNPPGIPPLPPAVTPIAPPPPPPAHLHHNPGQYRGSHDLTPTHANHFQSSAQHNLPPLSQMNAQHPPPYAQPPPKRPGRPRKHPLPAHGMPFQEHKAGTRGRRQGQVTKGAHLWEFIRDLLLSEKHNPEIIKWERKDEGVFRIVNSKRVASLWGQKKNNNTMNYEKLSRALRFCRSQDFFDDLPKDANLPKKLCFKFGSKAHGWQRVRSMP